MCEIYLATDSNGKWTGQGAEGSGLDILIAGGEHIHIPIKERKQFNMPGIW